MPYIGASPDTTIDQKDLNGQKLIIDADADTSIHASTDDQIDIEISGADDFRFTANNFNVLSGSTLTIDSGATIANSGTATGFADFTAIGDGSVGAPSLANSGDTNTGIDTLEKGLAIMRDRCVTFPEDSDARNNLVDYLSQFIVFCNKADSLGRANENCKSILLVLQPIVEQNPDDYALIEVYTKVQQLLGDTESVASAE